MSVAVIDTYALMNLAKICRNTNCLNQAFAALTVQVSAGALTFPDAVGRECRKFAESETCTVWAEAVTGHRTVSSVPYDALNRALQICRGVIDEEDSGEQSQPEIAAMVVYLSEQGREVTIISNDLTTPMDRLPLAQAASVLGAKHQTMREYVESLGLGALLI